MHLSNAGIPCTQGAVPGQGGHQAPPCQPFQAAYAALMPAHQDLCSAVHCIPAHAQALLLSTGQLIPPYPGPSAAACADSRHRCCTGCCSALFQEPIQAS